MHLQIVLAKDLDLVAEKLLKGYVHSIGTVQLVAIPTHFTMEF